MNMTVNQPVFTRTALAIAISLVTAHLQAADLPTGGNIVGGSGSISQNGNSLNVQQNSDKLITNWDSFDIGAGHSVNFYQPGSNSVALNRVIGEDASAIYGNLNANGKVFLVNPNGVLFGQGAAVNVGALVASTLSLSDEDFNNGNYQFQGDGNNAAVINRGSITADSGAVALLGGQVSNHGVIQANQGTVALAAGDQITLDFAGDGLLNVTVDEGTIDALVENHQLIRANGGQVVMTANATNALLQTVVNNTGIVEAQTLDNQNGTIVLKGGFNGGTVNVAGTLDASAPESGDGGFIDTSGAHVKIAGGTQVTTKASNGTTGEWLIDPTDFYITDSSDPQTDSGIGAATLSANLENNNVTLATVDDGTEPGDMYVNGAVSWDANTTLSLDAHNDIHINEAITATGTNAGLVLNTGAGKDYAIASDAAITLSGSNAALNINGTDYTLIHDMAALDAIDTTGLGGAYALAKNLDASGTTYDHALVGVDDTNAFTGTFAGLGHTISNLTINKTVEAKDYIGLFGVNNGLIRDIGLEGGSVSVFGNGNKYGGALAGYNDTSGIIVNVTATGNVNVNAYGSISYGGGLVGANMGTISHATAGGEVRTDGSGRGYSGGLVALNKGTITHATASGTVVNQNNTHAGRYGGGLVAVNDAGTITHATATGNVSSASAMSEGYMGGLVGLNNSGNITYTHATGNVSVINVSGNGYAGGLVGANNSGTITHSYATGNVSASSTGSTPYAGGLVGHNTGIVTYTYATGNVSGRSPNNLWFGGLVGHNQGDISYAYASGDTTTNYSGSSSYTLFLGGLVGLNQSSGTIDNAYATGTAKATNSAGTLAIGGFSGRSDGSITASYWDTEASGLSAGGAASGVTGLTTEQMLQADSFTGWDIDAQGGTGTVWRIYEGHTAPLLRNFLTALEVTGDSTTTYNGTEQSGTWSATDEYDANHIFGQASGGGRNAGTYNIDMSGLYSDQQGYDLITTNGTLTINKAQATVTANRGTTTYNGTEQSVSGFTVDGLVNGEDASVLTGVTTSGGKGTNAGSYTLTASGTDGNYELSFEDGALTINKAQATVTANSGTTTYNGTEQSVSGFTVDGLVNGEDASVLSGVTTSGGKGTNAGSYTLTVSGADGNYELSFVDGALTINKATATVTANSGTTTYNGTEQSVDGFTVDGLVNGEDANVLTGVTTSGGKGTNAGRYTLTASGSDGNYELTFVDGTLTINKAQATVTANSGTTTYNGTEQSVDGFTIDGLVNGEDASVLSGVTTNGGKGTNAGSYTLTASGADGNYDLTFVDGTLTINKAQATVIANSGTTTYDGAEQGGNGFTAEGLVNGETESVLSDVTISGGGRNAGSYVLTVSGADGNYDLTFVDGTLTIKRKTITADVQAQDKQFDGTPIAVLEGVLNGTISGDDVALQLSGLYASLIPGENRVLIDALLTGTDAGNYELIAPDSVSANMQGFVQNAGYQSAIVSQPHEQRTSDVPTDSGYVLTIDDDALRLTASGQ